MPGTDDPHPQTPPLSVSASDANPSQSAHIQRPFSPLTLDELGLHPPSTPSALLDIITPVSVAPQGNAGPATDLRKEALQEDTGRPKDASSRDGALVYSQNRVHKQNADSTFAKPTRSADLFSSVSSAPTTHSHESFLTSFLQSLTGESMLSDSHDSPSTGLAGGARSADGVEFRTRGSSASQIGSSSLDATSSRKLDVPIRLSNSATSSDDRHNSNSASNQNSSSAASHSLDGIPMSDFHRLFQTSSSARGYTNQHWATSVPPPSSRQSTSRTESSFLDPSSSSQLPPTATSDSSWTSLAPKGLQGSLVTSTPLEQVKPAPLAGDSQNETAKLGSASNESRSTQVREESDSSKPKWSLDLSGLSHFSLPQAPPLQPEHRYPISILETDGRYETDLDTDRDSETSPTGSHSFVLTPRSSIAGVSFVKRKSLDTIQSDRRASFTASCSFQSQDKVATSEAGSSTADASFKIVPLSNIVRSRSFSSASQSPSGSQEVHSWPTGSVESMRAESLARPHSIGPSDTASRLSDASRSSSGQATASSTLKPATESSTARAASYDFTRQALLDLIRRTNLGIANNASSNESSGAASSKNAGSSRDAPSSSSSFSAPPFTSSSNVPADLQARLQSWQHHRKRQRLLGEATNEPSKEQTVISAGSTTQSSSDVRHVKADPPGEEHPPSRARSAIEEQDHKSRRQEHYQRLLYQLNAQMQIKMRMDLQKQKQKDSQDKAQSEASSKRKGDSSKQVEFRKPGPPSKPSAARRMSLEAPSSSRSTVNAISQGRSSMQREGRAHSAIPGTPAPIASTPMVRSNHDALGASTFAAGGDRLPVSSSSVAFPALSAHQWSTVGDAIFWNIPQGGGASSSSRWTSTPQDGPAAWQPVCAPQYDTPVETFLSNWQMHQSGFNEPSWHSSSSTAPYAASAPRTSPTTSWTVTQSQTFPEDPNSILAMELMLKHPNWRRDLDLSATVPCVPSSGNSLYTPHYIDTSSFAISSATASASMVFATSQGGGTADASSRPSGSAAEKSGVKRPLSPGAEVVFWAVKGEHSVKLVGTVDSVSRNSFSFDSSVITRR
ncbi:conserved hypothetical protein [Sporisorium reilianum SRZ2]|uniref:Uncharacterized protein n=1 Tax=Sporisorium reilianum (strain SRZ2) TaxID=999809 RepID=E6ZTZ5_SPORE|nr:conserved hypothetical protein [Sporisorium reilianum SRZ2]